MTTAELATYFSRAHFIPKMKAKRKTEVLEELIQPLVAERKVKSKELVLMTLRQRESLGSTGIGCKIAIPHCRTLSVSEIHVVVGLSREGIDFDAMDGQKVHLFFLILAPPQEESNQYLPILGKICELTREEEIRNRLIHAENYDTFMDIIQGEG